MNINFGGLKQDYSFLFSGLNSSRNSSNNLLTSINLSDYNSIKTGTYGKLLKAYYKKDDVDTKDTSSKKNNTTVNKVDETTVKEFKEIQTESEGLRDSAAALMQRGSKSVFKDGDMDKIYKAVSDFAQDFNTVVEKGSKSYSKAIMRGSEGLINLAGDYKEELNQMGITIKDNKLSIDKDTFMKADADKVKALFNGQNSFAYLTSLRATSIGNTAYSESNKSSLYNGNGNYSVPNTGDLFNSII